MIRASVLAVLALLAGAVPAFADDAVPVLDGSVKEKLALSVAMLRSLPKTEIDISFETAKGQENGHYAGALLWTLIDRAGLINAEGKNTALRHTLLVTGRDGYSVALALGEIEPHFEAKTVILAYEGGDPPISPGTLRLIVPGDIHGGRSVSDVVHIEVK